MTTSAWAGYLAEGIAEITAYNRGSGGYDEVGAWPSSDLLWDGRTQIFVFYWMGDDRPHGFHIERVEEDDFLVTLYHADGTLELAPVIEAQQTTLLAEWERSKPADAIRAALVTMSDELSHDPQESREPTTQQSYEVMIEYQQPLGGEAGQWVPVGAWAADADEIVYWPLPEYAGQGARWQSVIQSALERGFKPLEILEYWYADANAQTVTRTRIGTVVAATALDAAGVGARQAAQNQRRMPPDTEAPTVQ